MSEMTDPRLPAHSDAAGTSQPDGSAGVADEDLSALFDGELDAANLASLSDAWAGDDGLRQQWQTYALIGDVLRTGEQARGPSHDRELFDAIRLRLAQEPARQPAPSAQVISLPAAAVRRAFWRRRAIPTAGIAAGLAFVGLMVWKLPQPVESGRELAGAPQTGNPAVMAVSAASSATSVAAASAASPDASPDALNAQASAPLNDVSSLPMRPYLQAHRAMTAGFAIDPGPGQLRRVAQEQVAR